MRIYLASHESRRQDMLGYAAELEELGHEIISRWICGSHELNDGFQRSPKDVKHLQRRFAEEKLEDIALADCLIFFAEPPHTVINSIQHVEFGIALGRGIRIMTVGSWANVFHYLGADEIERYDTWDQLHEALCLEPVAPPTTDFEWHRQTGTPTGLPVGTADQYVEFANDLYAEATELFAVANREYSDDSAWTANFDTVAHFMQMQFPTFKPRDAAMTYLMKSIFSITKDHTERQSLRSRYLDAINYLTFMAWMDEHDHDAEMTVRPTPGGDDCLVEAAEGGIKVPVPPEWPSYGATPAPDPVSEYERQCSERFGTRRGEGKFNTPSIPRADTSQVTYEHVRPGATPQDDSAHLNDKIDEICPAEWQTLWTGTDREGNTTRSQVLKKRMTAKIWPSEEWHKKSVDDRMKDWQAIKDRMYNGADKNGEDATKMSYEAVDKSVGI